MRASRALRPDRDKVWAFVSGIRASGRVKEAVKEKSPAELLAHYGLTYEHSLTHVGALLLGTSAQRRNLGTAPVVQAIKYDEHGQKVNKWQWDDYSLSPIELVEAIWREIRIFVKLRDCRRPVSQQCAGLR